MFSPLRSFFSWFRSSSSSTSAGASPSSQITASVSNVYSEKIEPVITELQKKIYKGNRPTSWDLKKLETIETLIRDNIGSFDKNKVSGLLVNLVSKSKETVKNAWIISAYASKIFNWSDKPSWEIFNSNLENLSAEIANYQISPKKPLGGTKERFQIEKSEDNKIVVLGGSTFTGDENDQLALDTRNFDSSISRVLITGNTTIGGVVSSADGWGRASGQAGDNIDNAGMTGCRVLSHFLSSLESPEFLTQTLATQIVQECDEQMKKSGQAANLAGVRIFPSSDNQRVQIVGVNVGNQRILAVDAGKGTAYLLNNQEGDDDSSSKICLGTESGEVKYKKEDIETINRSITIPKEKCIVLIATDGAWHNLPKAQGNPSKLDLDAISDLLKVGKQRQDLPLTPESITEKLKTRIEKNSKELRAEQKKIEEKIERLSNLGDRVRAAQNLEEALKKSDCLSNLTEINARLSSLTKVQGKQKGVNPDLEGFEIPDDWEVWLSKNKSKLDDLKGKITSALDKAKTELEKAIKNMNISDFTWGSIPRVGDVFPLSKEEQSKSDWNDKALDDATVTVIAPWFELGDWEATL